MPPKKNKPHTSKPSSKVLGKRKEPEEEEKKVLDVDEELTNCQRHWRSETLRYSQVLILRGNDITDTFQQGKRKWGLIKKDADYDWLWDTVRRLMKKVCEGKSSLHIGGRHG